MSDLKKARRYMLRFMESTLRRRQPLSPPPLFATLSPTFSRSARLSSTSATVKNVSAFQHA
jgi:hypothetical protein